jgi:L-fuconolactonase
MSLDVTGRYRYPPPDPTWLARHVEDVIDPELPIIDAHHHLWTEGGAPYLLPEITADVSDGHAIAATVFVQAHYGYRADLPPHLAPVGETEKVAAIAADAAGSNLPTRIAEGIVAHADLLLGTDVGEVLDAHEAAADGRLRGIRHSVSRDEYFPDGIVLRPARAGMLADPRYRAGLATLARRGLSYDAMLYHAQIPELTAVAHAEPDLAIVLDHLGCILGVGHYEGRGAETFAAWRRTMAQLAACDNVSVKFGGLGMIICGARWHVDDTPPSSADLATAWQPYFDTCIELFGPQRCIFESNFPVDKAMYSYRTLWNAFKRLTTQFSEDERRALFSGTASRVYRLRDPFCTLETANA